MNLLDYTDLAIKERLVKAWKDHQPKKAFSFTDYIIDKGTYEGTCTRKLVYEFLGVEPLWDFVKPLNAYRAEFGNVIEEYIEGLLKEKLTDWRMERQIKIETKVMELARPLHGRIDCVLSQWEAEHSGPTDKPKKAICLEIKSTHGRKFTNKSFGLKENGPDQLHLYQLGLYKRFFPYEWPDVEYHLIYFSREDFNRLVFVDGKNMTLPTEFDWGPWMRVEDYLEKKVLPPRNMKTNPEKGKDDFPCSWCHYVGTCWELTKYL